MSAAEKQEGDGGDGARKNVLVGVTGSVAAIKLVELVGLLSAVTEPKLDVRVVATEASRHFFDSTLLPHSTEVFLDKDEWKWREKGDPVLHIELRKWADLFLIAPLDANTLAKMANGLCDNLLTCVARAWDPDKPLLFCPAMNTHMWHHPLTHKHLHALSDLGYVQVPPVSKTLACGDKGVGAMACVTDISDCVLKYLI